jgi:hypothetical protein
VENELYISNAYIACSDEEVENEPPLKQTKQQSSDAGIDDIEVISTSIHILIFV